MSVILRVDEKVGHVISLLGENYSDKEFLDKFIEIYPDDYKNVGGASMRKRRTPNRGNDILCSIPTNTSKTL